MNYQSELGLRNSADSSYELPIALLFIAYTIFAERRGEKRRAPLIFHGSWRNAPAIFPPPIFYPHSLPDQTPSAKIASKGSRE